MSDDDPYHIVVKANLAIEQAILGHINLVNASHLCPTLKGMEQDFCVHYDLLKHYLRQLQKIKAIRLVPLFSEDDGLLRGRGYMITGSGKQYLKDLRDGKVGRISGQ